MSLHHFFLDHQVIADVSDEEFILELNNEDVKHARVLRLEPGEHISVVDASSDYFELAITSVTSDGLVVKITRHVTAAASSIPIVLVQGLAKGDKMDRVVRQTTELGVQTISPVKFRRSVVRFDEAKAAKKVQRLQTIAREAAMQSGQPHIPQVMIPENFTSWCKTLSQDDLVLLCWEEAVFSDTILSTMASLIHEHDELPFSRIIIVIGPEGGIDGDEVDLLEAQDVCCRRISLGPSILRTETAGIVALTLVQASLDYFLHKRDVLHG